jgi:hypothetical protein
MGADNLYDSRTSHTCVDGLNERREIQYGQGHVQGRIILDTVRLGDLNITQQGIMLVESIDEMEYFGVDGLLGLSTSMENMGKHPPVLVMMKEQKLIKEIVFSMYLSANPQEESKIVFGGYDPSLLVDPEFTFHKKSHRDYWMIQLQAVGVDMKYRAGGNDLFALADSGTSFIHLDSMSLSQFHQALSERGIECELQDQLSVCKSSVIPDLQASHFPVMSFFTPVRTYNLEPVYYVHGCWIDQQQGGEAACMLEIISTDSIPFVILGDTFMRKFYTLFWEEQGMIGFAEAKRTQPVVVPEPSRPQPGPDPYGDPYGDDYFDDYPM